jgi:demethylmenaquinone methyltransferase / 2-methoxy-6-polyprenyl-1,4-benzoquinol methylase
MGPDRASASKAQHSRFTQRLFSPLPERYDRLEALLSLGQNSRWRREMVDHVTERARGLVLDVATGTAGVALAIESRTGSRVVGVDLTEAMLREGARRVSQAGVADKIGLVNADADALPFDDASFDALCFTYLLRYVPDPQATMCELARVVRPGGVIASLEFMRPPDPKWRALWWLYTRVVLPIGGLATGGRAWFEVGRFLGPNISGHYRRHPLEQTISDWEKAGIQNVGTRLMSLGGGVVMWGRRADG